MVVLDDSHRLTQFLKVYDDYFKNIKRLFMIIIILSIWFFILVSGIALGYFASIVSDANEINDDALVREVTHLPEMPQLQTRNVNLIELYNAQTPLLIAGPAEVSPYVTKAIVSSEDAQFYTHHGVLPKAIFRAMYQDIFNRDNPTGGSTITQQLVKNQMLTNQKTYDRKAKEIMYAMRLENLMTKDEIIYTYINRISFGRDTYGQHITGITSASYGVFGKPPKTLNLAESAYLAGIVQSPYYYTPYTKDGDIKNAKAIAPSIQRQRYVLKRMYIEKVITKNEYRVALKYPISEKFI
ncbi:transglycosylase domain-containing protein [Staphylococcus ratti]|uniref:Penicillin-binding protein n=1 Tax=Staphylococcus ratti TaxID=2892440 RepID=A0ABY3PFN0_9STAP|nr:transglycosylase domain-containing protein [Staphylococcus ratti]UEX91142.1 penicillin-binding protein [Staphylococcus ratti]